MRSRGTEGPDSEFEAGPIRVLHVDDDPHFLEMAAAFVERVDDGVVVETETDPGAALDRIETSSFDCVVSDYEMPGLDGLEFLTAVRERDPDLPFVLLTGKGSEEIASDAISAGVTDYLQKETGSEQFAVLVHRVRNAVEKQRSRVALAKSQDRLALLIDRSPLGVVEWDLEFRVRRWNDTAEEVFGYSAAEALGRHASFLVPEDERQHVEEVWEEVMDGERPGDGYSVNDNHRKDGTRITCEWHNRAVVDDSGDVVSVLSLVRDVTERRRLEAAAAANERRFRNIAEISPDVIFRLDPTGTFTYLSPAIDDLLGYAPAELVGEPFEPLIAASSLSTVTTEFANVLAGERVRGLEVELLAADESRVWVDVNGVPVIEGGEVVGVQGIARDVTDRRASERDLAESEHRYRTLAEHLPGGVVALFDTDRRYTLVAGQGLEELSIAAADFEGAHFDDVDAAAFSDTHREAFDDALAGVRRSFEFEFEDRVWKVYTLPVRDADDEVSGGMCVSYDVTEQHERERALERQNERLEEFASVISHDIRNPLSAALGYVELALVSEGDDAEPLERAIGAIDRIDELLANLLTLTMQGQTVDDPQPVDLDAVVERAWSVAGDDAATLRARRLGTVAADESRLLQLFENLFRNALEHGVTDGEPGEPGEPTVTVTVEMLPDGFAVTDDGPGIPTAEREQVFESWHSGGESGTGLGLSIVRTIADAHGWSVAITDGESGGARFEITNARVFEVTADEDAPGSKG